MCLRTIYFTTIIPQHDCLSRQLICIILTDLCSCDEEVPWQYIPYAMQVKNHIGQVTGVFRYALFRRRSIPDRADLLDLGGRNLFIRCFSVTLASTHSRLASCQIHTRHVHYMYSTCFMPFTCSL